MTLEYFHAHLSMLEVGFWSAEQLLATYGGQARDLEPWLAGAELNCDRNLRLQYLAGMGLNLYDKAVIYDDMIRYRKFPDKLFPAPPRARLRSGWRSNGRRRATRSPEQIKQLR